MHLEGHYSNEYVEERLSMEFEGANRIRKGLRIVKKVILYNPIIDLLLANKDIIKNVLKRKNERNVILIALLNSAYPFAFDTLSAFGQYFTIQEFVNTNMIKQELSKIYGGNRSTENGLYSVTPMFLEAGFFERPKIGVYQFNEGTPVLSIITSEIYKASFNQCTANIKDAEVDQMNPYFLFIQ